MTPAQLMALADAHAEVHGGEGQRQEQGDLTDLMALARATQRR